MPPRARTLLALWAGIVAGGCGAAEAHEATVDQPLHAASMAAERAATADPIPVRTPRKSVAPAALDPVVSPEETRWTVPREVSLAGLERLWGVRVSDLRRLNQELRDLDGDSPVPAGLRLRVFGPAQGAANRSVGAPGRGRLKHGRPMPEGTAWSLRETRRRAWATDTTIDAVARAARSFEARYPDALPIQLGEFSLRRGGKVAPHKSHQSGRDVDIGYVLHKGTPLRTDGDGRFTRATVETLDAERTWFFVRELLRTGEVQHIYMGLRLQRRLYEHALTTEDRGDLDQYFRWASDDPRTPAVIRYQRGHHDHMHVRFRCPAGHPRCRP